MIVLRQIIKKITPPIFLDIFRRRISKYGFFGNFLTWKDAVNASTGYNTNEIIKKVKHSLLKVKSGKAIYERDSVLFDKIHYSWPLLAGLLWIASQKGNRLNLIDFGGSLGSSYFQNRKFLMHLKELKWNIVEQKKMVECGKKYFENEHLNFYYNLVDCIKEHKPNAILLSSVIQYIEKPYNLLKRIINYKFDFIIIDRTPFIKTNNDRLTVQKVSPKIYKASYPAWFFSETKFLKSFEGRYELIEEFDVLGKDKANIPSRYKGFIFRRGNVK
jgi:putative methyltransferase (TIGR04325 family)